MPPPSYPIDSPSQPSDAFLQARNVAGVTLQNQFRALGGSVEPSRDFRWIKADLTWPSFDHLTFGYRNQVFSVLVDLVRNGHSSLSPEDRQRCLDACRENHLVPCVFAVNARSMQPTAAGWNLVNLNDGQPVLPELLASGNPFPMSEWELRNFAIQVVRDHVEEQLKGRILSFCDVIGIDPQIWFEDASGSRCWVVVRFCRTIQGGEKNEFIGLEKTNPQLCDFDGFFAAVSATSSEAVLLDLSGKIIPPSRRFDGSAPLYRGDGFFLKFSDMERIHIC
jgi:hypothetical protein